MKTKGPDEKTIEAYTGSEALENVIASYDTLQKIVDQLAFCEYSSVGGSIVNNVAFEALRRRAFKEAEFPIQHKVTTPRKAFSNDEDK